MTEAVIVFVSQLALVFFKHLNVRLIAGGHVLPAVSVTALIQASWLVSSALGIRGFLERDYLLVVVYVLAGMIGSYLNFKINIKEKQESL